MSEEELSNLTMPVLLLGGSEDIIRSPYKIEKRLKKLLSNVKSKIFDNRGHVLVDVSNIILPFINNQS